MAEIGDVGVYGITGFYSGTGGQPILFSGHFDIDEYGSNKLVGLVVDRPEGYRDRIADISGELFGDKFVFDKKYRGVNEVVNYEFEKSDRGIWVGKYAFDGKRDFRGSARCKINLDWDERGILSLRKGV